MKKLFALLPVFFLATALLAQSNETNQTLTNTTPLTYTLDLNPELARPTVYNEVLGKFVKLNAEPNLMMFPFINATSDGPAFGSRQMNTIQFMDRDVEIQYLYDYNGVLRQSSFSLPFGKKKRSHSIWYVNPQ